MSSGSEIEYDEDQDYEKEIEGQSNQYDESEQNDGTQSPLQQGNGEADAKKQLIIQQNETDKACATYVFLDEDHTLGNALRYVLIHRPDVEFCGYSLPHPSETKMNLRLQTIRSTSTEKVLNEGLDTIGKMCDILYTKFERALNQYEEQKMN